jgi:hypothetical protein
MDEHALLSDLPKLFERNFAIGFLLPAVLLISGSYLVLLVFDLRPPWMIFHELHLTEAVAMLGLVWVTAITLLAINRPYVRFLEGYGGRSNPLDWLLSRRARAHFDKDANPALRDQQEVEAARKVGEAEPRLPGHEHRLRHAVENYPDVKEWVLPTKFGNKHRAIEVYSRVVYGIDAVAAWGRLEALLPKNFRDSLAGARAQMDFAVNLILAGSLILVLYIGAAIARCQLPAVWLPAGVVLIVVFGYSTALSSLTIYGNYVKSAFDLFRSELADHLGLVLPSNASEERDMWRDASRMMIYRSAPAWDRLEKFRRKETKAGE